MRSGFATTFFFYQLLLFPLFLPVSPPPPQKAAEALPSSETAIETVLRTQQDAWNRHDLDAFMAGYWNSPELTFSPARTSTRDGRPRSTVTAPPMRVPGMKWGSWSSPG